MQTVLVVDDDASVRELIELMLTMEGFTVFTAASGEEALEITRATQIDLVTIDLMMPGMSGWELSARLREEPSSAHCRQMIVSAAAEAHASIDTSLAVDAVLAKPFDFAAFMAALTKVLSAPVLSGGQRPRAELLDTILRGRLITPVFQPIVDLHTGEVVGVEALARGPEGSPLHLPGDLFTTAHSLGRLHELDSLCRYRAISEALGHAPLTPPLVFVNVEPSTAAMEMSSELREMLAGPLPFRVVVEFTERALTRRTPALIRHAEEIRGRGNAIALDDLGVDPRALAMLPLLEPEVVKLDASLMAADPSPAAVTTSIAVAAYAERTGAIVVAEGIETEAQRESALAMGARWGQGFLFARPGPMQQLAGLSVRRTPAALPHPSRRDTRAAQSIFTVATRNRRSRRGRARLLAELSRHLELQASSLGNLGVLLVALQDARHLTPELARNYGELATRAAILGIFGRGVPPEPLPGTYGIDLEPEDPLCREWAVIVLGPHEAAVLSAREVDDPDEPAAGEKASERLFDFVLSHDRALAEELARTLTRRLVPRPAIPRTTALGTG